MPVGIPHELRAAFVLRGRAWGAVHIARREATGPFTERDIEMLAQVTGAIAEASAARCASTRRGAAVPEAPGLVCSTRTTSWSSDAARPELLGRCAPRSAARGMPPLRHPRSRLVRPRRARSQANCHGAEPAAWITLHASLPDAAGGRVAIVIERATGSQCGDAAAGGEGRDRLASAR